MPRALIVAAALSALAAADDGGASVDGDRYRIRTDAGAETATEMVRVLDAAWPRFQAYFKKAPKLKKGDRLEVRLRKSADGWAHGDVAAVYDPETRTAAARLPGTPYGDRAAALHAAALQFHALARARNEPPKTAWYREGVARRLAAHEWNGGNLALGVLPAVAPADLAARALARTQADGFDFGAFVDDPAAADPALSWAVVRFLHAEPKWKAFAKKMDGGNVPERLFRKLFGDPVEVGPRFATWLAAEQSPFAQELPAWEPRGPRHVRGSSAAQAVCRLKPSVTTFEATLIKPEARKWMGGLLLSYTDAEHYTVAFFDYGGFLRIHKRIGKRWQPIEQGAGPEPENGVWKLLGMRKGKNVYLSVGPLSFGPWELEDACFGLALERCTLEFSHLRWR